MNDRMKRIERLRKGAERAAEAGDMVAFIELISAAAALVQIEKNLQRADSYLNQRGVIEAKS